MERTEVVVSLRRTLERTRMSILGTSTETSARRCFGGALVMGAVMLAILLPAPINADTIRFTHATVPLGISLAQFKRQYPECGAEERHSEEEATFPDLDGDKFEPLTGYNPPFPDLLPNYRGSYLTMYGPWGDPDMAVLGDGNFAVYFIQCQDESYTALIYQGKIAAVEKTALGQGPADRLLARLQQRLSGRQGAIHKARTVSGGSTTDVFVTYADRAADGSRSSPSPAGSRTTAS